MAFFSRAGDEAADQAQSPARVNEGGIPQGGQDRLQALAQGSLFTSGLSVKEFALLHRLGPRPLAQVMGASVIRTGWQYLPALPPGIQVFSGSPYSPTNRGWAVESHYTEASPAQIRSYQWHATVVCELDVLTDAWNLARRRALDRLSDEAVQVGADAVVGVHLRRGDHDLGKRTIEIVVTGTAIRLPRSTGASKPTLTGLSVQDYWRLHNAGHEPVGLVSATTVVFASPARTTRMQRTRTKLRNQELNELSTAFGEAREAVRTRLRGQIIDAHGAGAVGVELSHSVHREKLALGSSLLSSEGRGWRRGRFGLPSRVSGRGEADRRGWVITMHAMGTAVRRREGPPPPPVKATIRMGYPR